MCECTHIFNSFKAIDEDNKAKGLFMKQKVNGENDKMIVVNIYIT